MTLAAVTWVENEAHAIWTVLSADEAKLVTFFTPLFNQILSQAVTIGKGDIQAGLQVLTDATTKAVAAGTAALASGGNAVTAAESTFVSTTVSEGIVAVKNAEAGLIKAGVAIAQEAASDVENVVTLRLTLPRHRRANVHQDHEHLHRLIREALVSTGIFATLDNLTARVTAAEANITALQNAPATGVKASDLAAVSAQVTALSGELTSLQTLVGTPNAPAL